MSLQLSRTESRFRTGVLAVRLLAVGLLLPGCGGAKHAGSSSEPAHPPLSVTVDPLVCPETLESGTGKVAHEAYLRAHSDQTQWVAVHLRPIRWGNPACSSAAASADCPERDQALAERGTLNLKQVACVLAAFGGPGSIRAPRAQWYEELQAPSKGVPAPIGTAFSVVALWSQLEMVAQHPYVERIEPALGQAAQLGVAPPAIPRECPEATDAPDAKLVDAESIRGRGRMPVVIDLRTALLPAYRSCPSDVPCDDLFASGWERTVASTRQLTCVRSLIDNKLMAEAPDVPYRGFEGSLTGPKLPPFSASIQTTLSFGLGLTWGEVSEVAKHPYVERIWTSEFLGFEPLPDGCPPDYDTPVQTPACSSDRESAEGKFAEADQVAWQASGMANEVLMAIRRSEPVCPIPACPGRGQSCPDRDRYFARLTEETKASQSCVRLLIASIGGNASAEVFELGNALSATLTWDQIQTVAAHPDVISIMPRFSSTPPP